MSKNTFLRVLVTVSFFVVLAWGGPAPETTVNPTGNPTSNPTKNPTANPSKNPTSNPTSNPTANPTKNPTRNPTFSPTHSPTACRNNVRNFEMRVIGNSGKIDLFPPCNGTNERIRFTISGVTELEGSKKTNNKITTFANSGSWGSKREDYVDEANNTFPASSYTFVAQKSVGQGQNAVQVDFVLKIWLFFQRVNLRVSNHDCGDNCFILVDKNSLKYDVEFPNGWPFRSSSDKLELVVTAQEISGSNSAKPSSSNASVGITETSFGGYLIMKSPLTYFTGNVGNEAECTTQGGCVSIGDPVVRGTNTDVTFLFDKWSNGVRMRYDPSLTMPTFPTSTGGNSNGGGSTTSAPGSTSGPGTGSTTSTKKPSLNSARQLDASPILVWSLVALFALVGGIF